jgi:hypothetical protein
MNSKIKLNVKVLAFVIVFFLFFMIGVFNNADSKNKFLPMSTTQINVSKKEFERRKTLFLELQKELLINLKKTSSLTAISKFLSEKFYFNKQYSNSLPDEEHCEKGSEIDNDYTCHTTEEFVLKKIDKFVNIKNIIYVIENGEVNMSELTATCYSSKLDSLKYPYIDYRYNESKGKWFISVIRYEFLKD